VPLPYLRGGRGGVARGAAGGSAKGAGALPRAPRLRHPQRPELPPAPAPRCGSGAAPECPPPSRAGRAPEVAGDLAGLAGRCGVVALCVQRAAASVDDEARRLLVGAEAEPHDVLRGAGAGAWGGGGGRGRGRGAGQGGAEWGGAGVEAERAGGRRRPGGPGAPSACRAPHPRQVGVEVEGDAEDAGGQLLGAGLGAGRGVACSGAAGGGGCGEARVGRGSRPQVHARGGGGRAPRGPRACSKAAGAAAAAIPLRAPSVPGECRAARPAAGSRPPSGGRPWNSQPIGCGIAAAEAASAAAQSARRALRATISLGSGGGGPPGVGAGRAGAASSSRTLAAPALGPVPWRSGMADPRSRGGTGREGGKCGARGDGA
jgi:hypothetical protein